MLDTSARLLRLLSVLQTRRFWSGTDLAEQLEVTPRTLRRDVDRLRSLGYAIEAISGPGGGYQLGKGAAMPPLLLDDEEAIAMAVALRSATDSFAGLRETGLRALVKLEQLLPARLRRRLSAVDAMTVSVHARPAELAPDLLTVLAGACNDNERLAFAYEDRAGNATTRNVEPHRLAHAHEHVWYLVAFDVDREDWRTFRVDRIRGEPKAKGRFVPRPPPQDVADYVANSISYAPFTFRARVRLQGAAHKLAAKIPAWAGVLEPETATTSILRCGANTLDGLVIRLVLCGAEFELLEPAELAPQIRAVLERVHRALPAEQGRSATA